jgi:hypothetical protein
MGMQPSPMRETSRFPRIVYLTGSLYERPAGSRTGWTSESNPPRQ